MAGRLEGTYLDQIVAFHRKRAAEDRRDLRQLAAAARATLTSAPPRGFRRSLSGAGISLIAEVKRRSPSKGDLAVDLDVSETAASYERGGAAAISVLTDSEHFAGSEEDLDKARRAVELPVLRKDFTVSARDVHDARLMGADAVLLIVAALSKDELSEYLGVAGELSMDALVEIHDEDELALALSVGADLVGVNQRDLHSFEVDTKRAAALGGAVPEDVLSVAESGISRPEELAPLAEAGFDAVLIGELFVRSADRASVVAAFVNATRSAVYAMWVKICGITSEEDALLAVAMGADALGFIFAPSPRQMHPAAVQAITRRLPPEIVTVGVFKDERPQAVVDTVNRANLKGAQLHGNESREDSGYVAVRVPLVIKAFAAGDERLARAEGYGADVIMLDAPSPGSGKVFDWRLAEGAPRGRRLVLAGGLDPGNVAEAIRTVHPWGVDVDSGVERAPGLKDASKMRAFVQEARAAEPEPYDPGDERLFDWQEETNL